MNNEITYRCEAGHETVMIKQYGEPVAASTRCQEIMSPSCPYTAHLQGETNPNWTASSPLDPVPTGPLLADVGMELGEWIGEMLPGMQHALDAISAHRWSEEDRDDVVHRVGGILVDGFEALSTGREPELEALEREAQHALAMYVAAKARAHTKRLRRARV